MRCRSESRRVAPVTIADEGDIGAFSVSPTGDVAAVFSRPDVPAQIVGFRVVVADARKTLLLSGTGDLIEPDDGVIAVLGDLGFDGVHGLSEAFNQLFALTDQGEILLVDDATGQATLLHETGISFSGAASRR